MTAWPAFAQAPLAPPRTAAVTSLKAAYELSWSRQPEARAALDRREAAQARRDIAAGLFAEPPSVELSTKTGRFTRDEGSREYEAGVSMPMWLPGERSRAGALADAEASALDSRLRAAQLRTAAVVRDAYWSVERARIERDVAADRLESSKQLAADVARRVRAGDLSRADGNQAASAVAGAEVAMAEAQSSLAAATQQLTVLVGKRLDLVAAPEPVPATGVEEAAHAALGELADRVEVARRARELATVQQRANPELVVATARERGAFGEAYSQTVTFGVRVPFGSDSRARLRQATAAAEQVEAETHLMAERDRIAAAVEGARARLSAAAAQQAAAERRARLAAETRGFFDQSFRLGETDLPTRLRIELEAHEADRQLARARVEYALAISQLRQALGLLPE